MSAFLLCCMGDRAGVAQPDPQNFLEEVDCVRPHAARVRPVIASDRRGDPRKPVAGKAVRNDQNSGVRPVLVEKLDSEADEVVPVARDEAPSRRSGALHLFEILGRH